MVGTGVGICCCLKGMPLKRRKRVLHNMILAFLFRGFETFGYTQSRVFQRAHDIKELGCTMLGFAVALTMVASVTSRAGAFVLPISTAGTTASRRVSQVQTA